MVESYEDKFKAELYKRYNQCKKVLIPKDEYFTMIEELSLHSGIQRSPYAAMFRCEAKVGLTSSSLPIELVERLQSEDDLLSALSTSQKPVPSDNPMPTLTDESQPGTTEAPLPSTSDASTHNDHSN